jgi:uncharacterized protein YceK
MIGIRSKSTASLLALAVLLSGCATSQQQRAAPAESYATAAAGAAPASTRYSPRVSAYGTDGESMLIDTVFLRPVSLVGAAVGAAAWIVSLPFSLPSGSTGEAWDALVETPLNFTFNRPLGNISSCRNTDPGCRYPYPW